MSTIATRVHGASKEIAPVPPIPTGGSVGGDRVIKNGNLTLQVKKDGFSEAFDQAMTAAKGLGGFVVASSVSAGDPGRPIPLAEGDADTSVSSSGSSSKSDEPEMGTLTIRVPAERFEQLVSRLRKLGTMQNLNIDSLDVSQEFVDLKSRLRSWKAQEDALLRLMTKAEDVDDSILVQNQLREVQEQIETITGRIRYLDDQTEEARRMALWRESNAASFPELWGRGPVRGGD